MFLKKQFKPILDISFYTPNALKGHEENDKNAIIFYIENDDVKYAIFDYENDVFMKKTIAHKVMHLPFCYQYALAEFLQFVSTVHGTRETFDIDADGSFDVYNKKDGTHLKNVSLKSCNETQEPLNFELEDSRELSVEKAKDLSRFLSLTKRFSCDIPYFEAFNQPALLQENGLKLISTDGVHAFVYQITNNLTDRKSSKDFFIGKNNKHSQNTIKILSTFLSIIENDLHIRLTDKYLSLQNKYDEINIPLNPNNDFSGEGQLYQEKEDKVIATWNQETMTQITDMLNAKALSASRKANNFKNSLEVICLLDLDSALIEFDGNCEELNEISYESPQNYAPVVVCCYHLSEFIRILLELKVKEVQVYGDRIEGNEYRMYF